MNNLNLTSRIRENSIKYGSRSAIFYQKSDKSWTPISWVELWKTIEDMAKSLLANGIKPGDKVAIMSRNMPEWTISDYALQLVRAVSVPLFSSTSEAEAEFMLNETETVLILVGEQEQYEVAKNLLVKVPTLSKIIAFDSSVKIEKEKNSEHFADFMKSGSNGSYDQQLQILVNDARDQDLCTILYTSGTSGEPKGVMLSVANFMHCLLIHDLRLTVSDKDVSLCFLPLSHIFERGWTFNVLSKGMTSYYLRNPKEVVDAVQVVKPTLMCSVPRFFEKTYEGVNAKIARSSALKQSMFKWAISVGGQRFNYICNSKPVPLSVKMAYALADKLVLSKGRAVLGGNFRFMVCGGAAISTEIVDFFEQVGIHIKVGYGLTETTASVTCLLDDDINTSSVGKVMPLLEVKIGENNEIMVKGGTVFMGYYKKPELTAEVFKDGYFCTGDAGRLDENGYLYLTDRIKDIIKTSSGKYIAPQKIESLLSGDKYIEQITIIGNERKYVTALVVPSSVAFDELMKEMGLEKIKKEYQVKEAAVVAFYQQRINELQKNLSSYEQVKKIVLLPEEFTIQTGGLTPSLKIKRKVVAEQFKAEIESMYSGD
ncbi:MAG: long-chain fatty acid--CoA ligase [Bacteroidota bacterium]